MHWTCAAAFLRRFSWTNATSSPWMHPRQEITSCSWPSTDQVDNAIIWLFDTWEGTFTTSPLCCRRVEITRLLSSGAKSPFQVLRFNVWRERFSIKWTLPRLSNNYCKQIFRSSSFSPMELCQKLSRFACSSESSLRSIHKMFTPRGQLIGGDSNRILIIYKWFSFVYIFCHIMMQQR